MSQSLDLPPSVTWTTCSHPGCTGSGAYGADRNRCLAHLAEDELDDALAGAEPTPLDARGVMVTSKLLTRILGDERALYQGTRFDQAWFEEGVSFERTRFAGEMVFEHATFEGDVEFPATEFNCAASFGDATFRRNVTFAGSRFARGADFAGATFKGHAGFGEARFHGRTEFTDATFERVAWFGGATFVRGGQGGATFRGAVFRGLAGFGGATFAGATQFEAATFEKDAAFEKATFEEEAAFDRVTCEAVAGFTDATFERGARFRGASFNGYASFERASLGGSAAFGGSVFKEPAEFERANLERSAFDDAMFKGYAGFGGVRFRGPTDFSAVQFKRVAWFGEASFSGAEGNEAVFEKAKLGGLAGFGGAVFAIPARFTQATFADEANFDQAVFKRTVGFEHVAFRGAVGFRGAALEGDAVFEGASFASAAEFAQARFKRAAGFQRTRFNDGLRFQAATFEGSPSLGPSQVGGMLVLDGVTCLGSAVVDASAARVSCLGARFLGGVTMLVSGAEVALDETNFGPASALTGLPPDAEGQTASTRLISLRRARVDDLSIADLDLHACLFDRALGLGRLRIEGVPRLEVTPRLWRQPGHFPWRWTPRVTIAEEHRWRSRQETHTEGWYPAHCQSGWLNQSDSLRGPDDLEAGEVAAIYRALRRGRTAIGDQSVAGDFFYGEMEMRRNDHRRSRFERVLLWLYWLVSGYGLRATRALATLLVTIIVFALLLWAVGFESGPPFIRALLVSVEGALGLFRAPTLGRFTLSGTGEVLELVLRVIGPLFIGLAFVSLRARVKR